MHLKLLVSMAQTTQFALCGLRRRSRVVDLTTLREGGRSDGSSSRAGAAVIWANPCRRRGEGGDDRTRRYGTSHGTTRKEVPAVWVNSPADDDTRGVPSVSDGNVRVYLGDWRALPGFKPKGRCRPPCALDRLESETRAAD